MKLLFTLCLLAVFCANGLAVEKLGSREVLLDNSAVEVVRLTYPVGTESGMHSHIHPNRVVYFVKGGTLELVPENTQHTSKVINVADGDTLFVPASTHNVKNIGTTDIIIIETEIKAVPDPLVLKP